MANSWHCVAYGTYDSGVWVGELATTSLSGAGRDTGSFTAGDINVTLPEFVAVATGITGSSTHFTWAYGSEGVGCWNNANVAAIGEEMYTWLVALKAYQASTFSWKEVRISAVETDGTIVNGASVGTITTPIVGTGGMSAPPQNAIVSSLVTGGRGPRNRGRLFIPAPGAAPTADGLLSTAQKTAVNNASKAVVNSVNAISGIRAAVVSRTHGTYSDIIKVRVGDEFDTQRRRRNGRNEVYTALAV